MEIDKVNLDRKLLDKAYIQSKQDFQQLLKAYKSNNIPVWKQPLFFGVIGFASIASIVAVSVFQFESKEIQKGTIQKDTNLRHAESNIMKSQVEPTVLIASTFDKMTEIPTNSKSRESIKEATILEGNEEVISQEVDFLEVPTVRENFKSNLPNIDGNYLGDISVESLCSSKGIKVNDQKVQSFTFQYAKGNTDKTLYIQGNQVPASICDEITKNGVEQMVFITDIKHNNPLDDLSAFSMNFWVKLSL